MRLLERYAGRNEGDRERRGRTGYKEPDVMDRVSGLINTLRDIETDEKGLILEIWRLQSRRKFSTTHKVADKVE